MWVSSDTLWPVNLFIDLFADGFSLSGWQFSIAPCWIPDLLIVGVCYLFIQDPLPATLVAGAVHLVMLVLGFCLCWRALRIRYLMAAETLTIASAIAVTLWIAFHTDRLYPGFYQLLLPQTHVGNLIMHVYTIWLTMLAVRRSTSSHSTRILVGLGFICFLAGLSNLMYFAHTILPISIALLFLWFVRAVEPAKTALLLIVVWLAALAGAITYRSILPAMDLTHQSNIGYAAWRTAAVTFLEGVRMMFSNYDFQHVWAALWLAGCAVVGARFLWRLRNPARAKARPSPAFVLFFLTAATSSILGPLTVIAGGSNGLTAFNNYVWTMHYLHPTFLLPLFAWPIWTDFAPNFALFRLAPTTISLLTAMVITLLPTTALGQLPKTPMSIYNYQPAYVRSLDQLASRYGIKYGLAGYWQARVITLLSKSGMRVYPVDGSLTPFTIVSNTQWYKSSIEDKAKKPCFSFVVLDDPLWKIQRIDVIERLGEPTLDVSAAGTPVMIYSNGTADPQCLNPF